MKVKELIEELSKYDGDWDVRVYVDHGQEIRLVDGTASCVSNNRGIKLDDWWFRGERQKSENDNSYHFVGIFE